SSYNSKHRYYVDGSPMSRDVQFADGSWHTILVGGLGAGGKGMYALDVTDPSQWSSEAAVAADMLWSINSSNPDFQHLGLTFSKPQVVVLDISGEDTPVVVFGSGYNNDDGKPYLYVVNAEAGALIRSIDLCAEDAGQCDASLRYGLSTPAIISGVKRD